MEDLKRVMLLRRAQLEQGREEALAQANANAGAIAEIDYWLKEMEHASEERQIEKGDLRKYQGDGQGGAPAKASGGGCFINRP